MQQAGLAFSLLFYPKGSTIRGKRAGRNWSFCKAKIKISKKLEKNRLQVCKKKEISKSEAIQGLNYVTVPLCDCTTQQHQIASPCRRRNISLGYTNYSKVVCLPEKRDGKLLFRKCFESLHAGLRDGVSSEPTNPVYKL